NGRVYFKKQCARCGPSEALVSEDARYYVRAYAWARAGTEPLKFGNHVEHGCPTDCGTCEDHEQHTCLPIVEVTDHCNLACPICRDHAFAHAITASGAYIGLQLDGFTADTHEKIRGRDLCAEKDAALRVLKELRIPTQIIYVAARGVNEDQIGRVVDLYLGED